MSSSYYYDPKAHLVHFPTPMERFGKVPGTDKNQYRIVYSKSRKRMVGGVWDGPGDNGQAEYRWVEAYLGTKNPDNPKMGLWIMERWTPPWHYCQKTREEWNRDFYNAQSGLISMGPYPSDGEYQLCHIFEHCNPDNANLEKLVNWVEAGRRVHTFAENREIIREQYAKEEKEKFDTMMGICMNALPAFGSGGYVGPYGSRGTKTAPILRTAQELGLPTKAGISMGRAE